MNILRPHRRAGRRAFSLPEILMAVFILAIGVISIAALLPAGIAQQQRSVDDVLGPAVAQHALGVIRSKVSQDDFGSFEDFPASIGFGPFSWQGGRPDGDWGWLRPAFVPAGDDPRFPRGGIDLFNATRIYDGVSTRSETDYGRPTDLGGNVFEPGIPYSFFRYGANPPEVFITREERAWPSGAATDAARNVLLDADLIGREVPQYYWECMFQRQGGRVRVAIFVYRVVRDQASRGQYVTAEDATNTTWPPLPYRLDLADPPGSYAGVFDPFDATIPVTAGDPLPDAQVLAWNQPVDLLAPEEAWTLGDQWLLDQNGFVYRVLFGRDASITGPVDQEVVLANPVPELLLPPSGPYEFSFDTADLLPDPNAFGNVGNGLADRDVVSEIWYLPVRDSAGRRLVPVHCTVREL